MFTFLIKYYLKQKIKIIILFIISLILSLTIVIIPLLIRKIIDNFILYEIENHLFLLVILLAILFILLNAVYPLLLNSIVNKTNSQLRRDIMEKLKNKKIEQLSKNGDKVMQVIINDVPVCQSLLTSFAFNIIIQLITFTCIVIILLNLHLKLGLIILLFVPFYISIFFIFGKKLEEINANYLSIRDRLSGNIQNIILNKNILKHSINKKSTYYKKYEKNLYGIYYWYRKQGRFDSVIKTLFNLLQVIIFLFVIFYGKDLIEEKEITIGSYIAFVMFTFNFFSPIHEIIDLSLEFKTAIVSVRRVYQIYTLKEESNLFREKYNFCNSEIMVSDYSLPYIKLQKKKLISFSIKQKKLNFIVGKNGSGKTTFVNMLNGYIDVPDGVIKIGSRDINSISLECLRMNVRTLYQTPEFVDDEIISFIEDYQELKRNISLQIKELIDRHLYKYENKKFINNLSGGEKQLLCFFEALLSKPKILIIDEGFSNLDSTTTKECLNILNEIKYDTTILIVTHDVSLLNIYESHIINFY